MRTWTMPALAGLALAGALSFTPQVGRSADHREAPAVDLRPASDINDIYAFVSPTTPGNVVLIMTVNPVADPDFAGTYAFSPNTRYRIAADVNGDVVFDRYVDLFFTPVANGSQTFTAFLPGGRKIVGTTTPGTVRPSGPNEPIINSSPDNRIKIFAGLTDDPFFFDGVGFSRALAGTGGFRGEDSFAGFNVSSIVIELPASLIAGSSKKIQIEGFTSVNVSRDDKSGLSQHLSGRRLVQFDRVGNPAVATAFIPAAQRDAFNQSNPRSDARRWAPTIVSALKSLGTSDENIAILASVAVPDTLKLDLTQPQGFPNGRRPADDVVDTLLTLVFNTPTGDEVDANDVPFPSTFPYLAPPQQAN
ncbi:MAG: DUF4331 family protein [Geminicoccaceae bacterium]|nr:DUF4331 family protein [Geminicoccaceae bacterium]